MAKHNRGKRRGLFVVFEGIDGAGTTTQTERTAAWLREQGERVHITGEPSTGPIGTLLRQVLGGRLVAQDLDGRPQPMDPATVALLFAADRLDHLQNEIQPHLAEGTHVLCDRYVLSSLAYQSVDVDLRFVRQVNEKAPPPDVTFLLETTAEVAMGRVAASRRSRDGFENLPFQRRVAARYAEVARAAAKSLELHVLNGERAVSAVCTDVRAVLAAHL